MCRVRRVRSKFNDRRLGLDPTCRIENTSRITPGTTIGRHTGILGRPIIKGGGTARIGSYCAIAEGLSIITSNHATRYANMQVMLTSSLGLASLDEPGDVAIGSACWIGDRVTITCGVTIGHGVVIGAGAVVTRDIGPFVIAAGVPARTIRPRFTDDVIAMLLDLAWWDWSQDRLARNRAFFATDLTAASAADITRLVQP